MAAEGSLQTALSRITRISFLFLVASLGSIQIPVAFGHQDLVPTDFLFLVTGGLWMVSLLLGKRRFFTHRFYWLLFFYLAALFFSCFFSANPTQSFWRMPAEVYLVGLSVLSFNLIENEVEVKHTVFAWLCGAAISVL